MLSQILNLQKSLNWPCKISQNQESISINDMVQFQAK